MDDNAELRNMVIRDTMGRKPKVTEVEESTVAPVTQEPGSGNESNLSDPGLGFLKETLTRRATLENKPSAVDEARKKVTDNVDSSLVTSMMKIMGGNSGRN